LGLADVEHLAAAVTEEVDARPSRQRFQLVLEPRRHHVQRSPGRNRKRPGWRGRAVREGSGSLRRLCGELPGCSLRRELGNKILTDVNYRIDGPKVLPLSGDSWTDGCPLTL